MADKLCIAAAGLIAIASLCPAKMQAQNEYWHQKVSLFEILPVYGNDIVFLGNSITDGGEFAEIFKNPAVKNRGISADVISGVRKRLGQIISGHPAQIFLLIGINDVSHNLSAKKIAESYERLVREIRQGSPETELIIQSVMPIDNSFGRYRNLKGKEQTITALNAYLTQIAERNGAKYIDLWPALADSNGRLKKGYTNDGLHLTGEGYKAWTDLLRPYLKNSIEHEE